MRLNNGTFSKLHKELWENIKIEISNEKKKIWTLVLNDTNYEFPPLHDFKKNALDKVIKNHKDIFDELSFDSQSRMAMIYLKKTCCFACMVDFQEMITNWDFGIKPPRKCENCPLLWGNESNDELYSHFCNEPDTPYYRLKDSFDKLDTIYFIFKDRPENISYQEYLSDINEILDDAIKMCDEIANMDS